MRNSWDRFLLRLERELLSLFLESEVLWPIREHPKIDSSARRKYQSHAFKNAQSTMLVRQLCYMLFLSTPQCQEGSDIRHVLEPLQQRNEVKKVIISGIINPALYWDRIV